MIKGKLTKLIKVNKNNFNVLYNFLIDKKIMGNFQKTYNFFLKKLENKILNNNNNKYFLIRNFHNKDIGFMYYIFENRFNAVEIGGAIIQEERSKGYGLDSHKSLINSLFKSKRASRIQAIVSTKNKIEIELLKKCGMRLEGVLKRAGKLKKMHDLAIFAVLNKYE